MSINEFLSWVVYSGGGAILVSKLLELIPAFQTLASQLKWWINLVGVLVVVGGFYAVLTYVPVDLLATIDPWFKLLSAIVISYTGGQIAFKATKQ